MKIPEQLQHFKHPTLIVMGNFNKAAIYSAAGSDMDKLETLVAPRPGKPRREGSLVITGQRFHDPAADQDEGADRFEFVKLISQAIKTFSGKVKYIDLVMPAEMIRRIKEEMPKAMRTKILKILEKDLMKEKLVEIVKRLEQVT